METFVVIYRNMHSKKVYGWFCKACSHAEAKGEFSRNLPFAHLEVVCIHQFKNNGLLDDWDFSITIPINNQ